MFKFENLISKLFGVRKIIFGLYCKIREDLAISYTTLGKPDTPWAIIDDLLDEDSIVYSLGIGNDISFDLDVINNFDLRVFAFDPTPESVDWIVQQKLPNQFIFNSIGIANYNGKATFYPPTNPNDISASMIEREETKDESYKVDVRSLSSIMSELEHRNIDLLKMSVEGVEHKIIDNMIKDNIKPKQLLVEFSNHNIRKTRPAQTKRTIELLRKSGYKIFYVSKTMQTVSFVHGQTRGN